MMMSDSEFGFGGVAVADDTTIPDNPALGADDDFQFDESQGGQFPPRITPGPVHFRYEVTGFKDAAANNGKASEVTYTAHVQVADLGPGRLLKDQGLTEIPVRFCRASDYKSAAMKEKKVPSDAERLYAALGLVEEVGKPTSRAQMWEVLRGASGRIAKGSLVWSAAIKNGTDDKGKTKYETFSTSPNIKRGDKPWPRTAEGQLALEVTFSTGESRVGREEIGGLVVPKVKK